MSILCLADGTKLKTDATNINPQGLIENRTRPIVEFSFVSESLQELGAIEAQMVNARMTETMTIYFNEDDPEASDNTLNGVGGDPENAPAKQVLEGYTMIGKTGKERGIVTAGTLSEPPVYGWKLTVQLGQRLWDEAPPT